MNRRSSASGAAPRPAAAARIAELTATRRRIVDAARVIVADSGWHDAQIAGIAERARVATGSVYRHFASKADLYAEVLASVSQREIDVVRQALAADGPASARLAAAIRAFLVRAVKGRRLAYALIAEPCEPEIDAERLKYRASLAAEVAGVIREGIRAGEFARRDASVAASCVTGAFMEALVGPLAPRARARSGAAFAGEVAELCVAMLRRTPRRRARR